MVAAHLVGSTSFLISLRNYNPGRRSMGMVWWDEEKNEAEPGQAVPIVEKNNPADFKKRVALI